MTGRMESSGTFTELKGGKSEMEQGIGHNIDGYLHLFNEIMGRVNNSDVALAILHEVGKDGRLQRLQADRMSVGSRSGSDTSATVKQKNYLRRLGISFDENISKSEASRLIDEAVEKEA